MSYGLLCIPPAETSTTLAVSPSTTSAGRVFSMTSSSNPNWPTSFWPQLSKFPIRLNGSGCGNRSIYCLRTEFEVYNELGLFNDKLMSVRLSIRLSVLITSNKWWASSIFIGFLCFEIGLFIIADIATIHLMCFSFNSHFAHNLFGCLDSQFI